MMAKNQKEKVTKAEVAESGKAFIEAYIKKDFGNGLFKPVKDLAERKLEIIRVCPAVNMMLGGGIPTGVWVNIAGRPKCGKTTTVLWTCLKAQQMGMEVYYLNVEHRLKPMNLAHLPFDSDRFHIIESSEDKLLSCQDYLNIAEKILLNNKRCVLVIDSLAALTHLKEHQEGVGVSTRGGPQVLIAQFCRQMTEIVPIKGHIVLTIQQIGANTSGFGASTFVKGGNAITYQGDIIMREKKVEDWKVSDKTVGQKVTWEVDCTALGGFPGSQCTSYLRYGKGIDEVNEIIDIGKDLGQISGSAWLLFDFVENHLEELGEKDWSEETQKKYKANGQEKAAQFLLENPKLMSILENDLIEVARG